ncbi:hypothetical protein V2G26_011037 [Clonostachys chloroleuca]
MRQNPKPLEVLQPQGPPFEVNNRVVSWQKWKFQLGWNLREGPVLHNVRYDNRSLFYRVPLSGMTVPYGDPRSPYYRKQASNLGDSGFGLTSNSLEMGCDCLGHIAYFDGIRKTSNGDPGIIRNVVCMHEVDDGVGWKHTNWRNGGTSVARDRQPIVQCTVTVANSNYILAFVLDQAANLHIEAWTPSVAPFASNVRQLLDLEAMISISQKNRVYSIINESRTNPVSGKRHGYKLYAIPSQMLMMDTYTFNYRRGVFASRPIWVTRYRDDGLWAAGESTNQSREDTGLPAYAAGDENIQNEDVALWHSFDITHVTRPEDFPVMPVEKMSMALKPTSFFDLNPANDVPRSSQTINKSTLHNSNIKTDTSVSCCANNSPDAKL